MRGVNWIQNIKSTKWWNFFKEKAPLWQSIAMWLLVYSPALVMAFLVAEHAVNIPVWDDWERAELLRRYHAGELDFSYLLAPHIEHRIFFPRLAILGLNGMSGGDLRWEMWLTFAVMLGYSILLIQLVRRTIGRRTWVIGLSFLINLLVFSPIQFQNFLWAIQTAFVLPMLGLAWCIWIMTHPNLTLTWKLIFSLVGAVVATLSFGHGLFVWLVPLGLGLLLKDFAPNWKRRWAFLGVWIFLAVDVGVWYFGWQFENVSAPTHAYGQEIGEKPPALEHWRMSMENLGVTWDFFMGLLGNPLARTFVEWHEDSAIKLGWILLTALIAGIARWIWVFKDGEQRDAMLPWLALAGFGIAATLAIAVARSWLGMKGALIPRYSTVTLPVWIGVLGLWATQLRRWREAVSETENFSRYSARMRIAAVSATAFAMFQLPTWLYGIHQMRLWEEARLEARVSLIYIRHFPVRKLLRLDAVANYVRSEAEFLNSQGLLDPPLVEGRNFGPFRRKKSSLSKSRANITDVDFSEDGAAVKIEGHAILPKDGRCADGVLAAIYEGEGDDGKWKAVGLLEMEPMANLPAVRMDYQFTHRKIHDRPDVYGAWDGAFLIADVPTGERVTFWALDAKEFSAHKIKQSVRITGDSETGFQVEMLDD